MQQEPEQSMPPQSVQTQPAATPAVYRSEPNTLALVSLISGILSWFAVPIIGAVVAVVTGHMARAEIRRTGEPGEVLAIVGLVLGYLHLAVVLLIAAIVLLVLFGVFAAIRATTTG